MEYGPFTLREPDDGEGDLLYPAPSPNGHNWIELASADGPRVLTSPVTDFTVNLWQNGKMREQESVSEIHMSLHVTDSRIAFACSNYDKGGGWIGGSTSIVLNAGSKIRAAVRSQGLVLVGQVRYAWLESVGGGEKQGMLDSEMFRIVIDRKVDGVPTSVYLDFSLPNDASSVKIAAEVARRAARYRLNAGEGIEDPNSLPKLEHLAQATEIRKPGAFGMHDFPGAWPISEASADLASLIAVKIGSDSVAPDDSAVPGAGGGRDVQTGASPQEVGQHTPPGDITAPEGRAASVGPEDQGAAPEVQSVESGSAGVSDYTGSDAAPSPPDSGTNSPEAPADAVPVPKPIARYCTRCGGALRAGSSFCGNCGIAVAS